MKKLEIYEQMPKMVKIALFMYIIPAGLNAMYDLGYMFGRFWWNIMN